MFRKLFICVIIACVSFGAGGCRRAASPRDVAVTNTLFECAVAELLGSGDNVLLLCEPGMCPGHVELRPSQVQQLRHSKVMLRFDFQRSMDKRITSLSENGLEISEIAISGGICRPSSYVDVCRQIAAALVDAGLIESEIAEERLEKIADRMNLLSRTLQDRCRTLSGAAALTSMHQKLFCQWLGLDVVDTFSAADVALVSDLDEALTTAKSADVKLIIANRPEGTQLASSLAERLGAAVAVFDNFPIADSSGKISYDSLLIANVDALLEAAGK